MGNFNLQSIMRTTILRYRTSTNSTITRLHKKNSYEFQNTIADQFTAQCYICVRGRSFAIFCCITATTNVKLTKNLIQWEIALTSHVSSSRDYQDNHLSYNFENKLKQENLHLLLNSFKQIPWAKNKFNSNQIRQIDIQSGKRLSERKDE